MNDADTWSAELSRAVGREFGLPAEEECRVADDRGHWTDVRVLLPAGTAVRLLGTTYDTSRTRVYHRLAVLSGSAAGSMDVLMDGPRVFPWESARETAGRLGKLREPDPGIRDA